MSSNKVKGPRKRKIKIEEISEELVKRLKEEDDVPGSSVDLDTSSFHFQVEKDRELRDHELLADLENIDPNVSLNIVRLFEDDNTIPFIARYRKDKTGGMTADRLRALKEAFDSVKQLRLKATAALNNLSKQGPVEPTLAARIRLATSLEEIELLIAPFKKENKGSLAARAKEAGLEEVGRDMLLGSRLVDPRTLIKPDIVGRENIKNVWSGLQHIIADIIAKDAPLLNYMQTLKKREPIFLECSLKKGISDEDKKKYENYENFRQNIRNMRPHQVLAINRAESQKVLSVKVVLSNPFWAQLKHFGKQQWLSEGQQYADRTSLFNDAITDCFQRLLTPVVIRQIRRTLTEEAERSSITVFATNLKNLLLQAPLRGKVVMAIDPGVTHGCKLAIVSPNSMVLHVDKFFLSDGPSRSAATAKLIELCKTYQCETIALGNGTYCRQTEEFLSGMIQSRRFSPLDVSYTIVNEQGVSIYSCSPAAAKEFPGMDPNLVSAVSLARRLQDPLAELVKVEPKHLGVGMYQHDIQEKKLSDSLKDVVSECVSFVGVDLNTASLDLLTHVAGLTNTRATVIAKWRLENGPFQNRQQLLKVKGIGSKTFQQCAGFVRILPTTAKKEETEEVKKEKKKRGKTAVADQLNPFDMTEIHPEDYALADRLLQKFKLPKESIGQMEVISVVKTVLDGSSLNSLALEHDVSEDKIKQVLEALSKEVDHDMRTLSQTPVFRRGVTTIDSLKTGSILSGVVRNVTHFGAFVDIGVGRDGLIHSSALPHRKENWVKLGDRVDVCVLSLDLKWKKIGLRLVGKLSQGY